MVSVPKTNESEWQEKTKTKGLGQQHLSPNIDCLSYIFIVSGEYKDYTFDYDDMAG